MADVNLDRSSDDGLPDNPWRPNPLLDTIGAYQMGGQGPLRRVYRIFRGVHDGERGYFTAMWRSHAPNWLTYRGWSMWRPLRPR